MAVTPVHGHALAEGGYFLRELLSRLITQKRDPLPQRRAGGVVQPADLLVRQGRGLLERRQTGGMQNLVRIRVAYAAEQMRIGQRALQRMIPLPKGRGKLFERRFQYFESTRIVLRQRVASVDDVERRLPPGASLRQDQRAVRKIERE